MFKKLLLKIISLALIVGVSAFIQAPAAAQEITLNFNTLFHSGDAQAMERIVQKFNEEHDDVQIILTQGSWSDYYAQLYNAVVAGNAPQIGITHTTMLPQMAVALTPLNDSPAGNLLEAADISADDYISDLWEAGSFEGNQYLVPLDSHMFGLWYNKDIFEEAGLDPNDPPETREEFEAAANAIIDNTDKYAVHFAEDGLPRKLRRAWFVLYWQQGGELLNEDATQATFNNEMGVRALEYLVSMVQDKNWNIPAGDGFKQFSAGELGMLIAGNWFFSTAEESGVNYGFHYTPIIFDHRETWGNSHNLVIPKQPEGTSEEIYIAAAEAIKWINENSDMWGIYGGHIPAYNEARESEELRSSKVWQVALKEFSDMAQEGALHYGPTHPKASQINDALNVYIEQAYNGTITAEEALAQAEAEVNDILSEQ